MAIVQIYLDHREDIDELRRRSVSENLKIFCSAGTLVGDARASKKLVHTMYTQWVYIVYWVLPILTPRIRDSCCSSVTEKPG